MFYAGQQSLGTPTYYGLQRKRGQGDLVTLKVKRGESITAALAEVRRIVSAPACHREAYIRADSSLGGATLESWRNTAIGAAVPLSTALPEFWEQVNVSSLGPFQSTEDAKARLTPESWPVVETVRNVDPNEIRRSHGCAVQMVTVPDVMGRSRSEAESILESAGFQVALRGGNPSKQSPDTVESQDPKYPATLAPNGTVTLRIHTKFVEPRKPVPNVIGRNYKDAQSELESVGFQVALRGGDPSPQSPRTVQSQDPEYPATLAPNGTVTLRIYTDYVGPRADPPASLQPPRVEPSPPVLPPRVDPPIASPPSSVLPPPPSQQAQWCDRLLRDGFGAIQNRDRGGALDAYNRGAQNGCDVSALGQAIAEVDRVTQQQNQQQQHDQWCNNLIQGGFAAVQNRDRGGALAAYNQGAQNGCDVSSLGQAIAEVDQSILQQQQDQAEQAQQCALWLQLGESARSFGHTEQALNLYQLASNSGCRSQELDKAIADLQRQLQPRQPVRPVNPQPSNQPHFPAGRGSPCDGPYSSVLGCQ